MRLPLRPFVFSLLLAAAFLPACSSGPDPNDPEVQRQIVTARNLGLAYLEEGQFDEAEAQFLELTALVPNEASGWANLGVVYLASGRYDDAEANLDKAQRLSPDDPQIPLLLARVYLQTSRTDDARRTLTANLEAHPDHVETLYQLLQLEEDAATRRPLLDRLTTMAPANIVTRLHYAEALLQTGDADAAGEQLEQVRQLMPALPEQAAQPFQQALEAARAGDAQAALRPTRIAHNFLRSTPYYQTGLQLLEGARGQEGGAPVLSFGDDLTVPASPQEALAGLRFAEASANAGLAEGSGATALAAADYDGDDDTDLVIVTNGQAQLLRNTFGVFETADGSVSGTAATAVAWGDFDNDGLLDLALAGDRIRLFRNDGNGGFADATPTSLRSQATTRVLRWLDLDQDGDLDLFAGNDGPDALYRNNGDGSFTDFAAQMGLATAGTTADAAFGDFDDDGDLDFVLARPDGSVLYTNQRQARFADVSAAMGLGAPAHAVATADFNSDGFLDLVFTGDGGTRLLRNQQNGTFTPHATPAALSSFAGRAARFLDVDNDGFLDLALTGPRGTRLFRNDGTATFTDLSDRLDAAPAATALATADYNQDRDLDLLLAGTDGITLLRNDGGNVNKSFTVKLQGLLTGSGKNNYFGIGSRLDVRAGELYQTFVVSEPTTHVGLGNRLKADVVRIVWPNGTPQNLFFPGSDQDLVEEQILKGSCPFLYTWDGNGFTFATDLMWRSAPGMPLGIMGGERAYAPPGSAKDYVRVGGEQWVAENGVLQARMTAELWETIYVDKLRLIAVDHPATAEVYVNERFGPPPTLHVPLHPVAAPRPVVHAEDDRGNDLTALLAERDADYVWNLVPSRYQGTTETHDLILDLGDFDDTDRVQLFLNGWIFPTDASINIALSQSDAYTPQAPALAVSNGRGGWVALDQYVGFPMGKNKTVVIDLTGAFPSADRRVRLRTNLQVYWDHAFVSINPPSLDTRRTELAPARADLRYRGFSRLYRTSRYGPHLFDYADTNTAPKWRDLTGAYTRYGDVLPLLDASENQYVIMNAGDEIVLEFDATTLPPLPAGWTRTYVFHSDGWVKDGDLNTAHGQTVAPLPYHGMSAYPYGPGDAFPDTPALRRWRAEYNTRHVTGDALRTWLRGETDDR